MRVFKCLRRCHGFRGGMWNEGDEVEVADGEDVPRHFVPIEEYQSAKANENKPPSRPDPMNPKPSIMGQQSLIPKGGMGTSVKPDPRKVPINRVTAGEDI